jgi:hypothetical protein
LIDHKVVREGGLEPPYLAAPDPKLYTSLYASSNFSLLINSLNCFLRSFILYRFARFLTISNTLWTHFGHLYKTPNIQKGIAIRCDLACPQGLTWKDTDMSHIRPKQHLPRKPLSSKKKQKNRKKKQNG